MLLPAILLALAAHRRAIPAPGVTCGRRGPTRQGDVAHALHRRRWLGQPFTFLVVGVLAALMLALVWSGLLLPRVNDGDGTLLFAIMLAAIGLGLVLVPEIVYLATTLAGV